LFSLFFDNSQLQAKIILQEKHQFLWIGSRAGEQNPFHLQMITSYWLCLFTLLISVFDLLLWNFNLKTKLWIIPQGSFTNYVTHFLTFFDIFWLFLIRHYLSGFITLLASPLKTMTSYMDDPYINKQRNVSMTIQVMKNKRMEHFCRLLF